jgi:hypothetical protein
MKTFRVKGICLVPTEVEMEIEAPDARRAVMKAQRSDWKMQICPNDADFRSAFDWRPTAEEINSSNETALAQPCPSCEGEGSYRDLYYGRWCIVPCSQCQGTGRVNTQDHGSLPESAPRSEAKNEN